MIHESRHWKDPLLRAATCLSRIRIQDDESSEKSLVRVEREIFIGFYAIRKLCETLKVSMSTKELTIELSAFMAKPDLKSDYFNRANIDALFEMGSPMKERRDIGFLCNQIIHSYIFIISILEDGALKGFYVTSDSMRFKKLYFIELDQIINTFRLFGMDYPNNIKYQRNVKTGQLESQ